MKLVELGKNIQEFKHEIGMFVCTYSFDHSPIFNAIMTSQIVHSQHPLVN